MFSFQDKDRMLKAILDRRHRRAFHLSKISFTATSAIAVRDSASGIHQNFSLILPP